MVDPAAISKRLKQAVILANNLRATVDRKHRDEAISKLVGWLEALRVEVEE